MLSGVRNYRRWRYIGLSFILLFNFWVFLASLFLLLAAGSSENRQSRPQLQVSSAGSDEDLTTVHFSRRRAWNLRVQQIPCGCNPLMDRGPSLAPDGCLSFYPDIAGDIKTFNYDHTGCYRWGWVGRPETRLGFWVERPMQMSEL